MTRAAFFSPLLVVAVLAVGGCDGRSVRDILPWERFSIASTSMEPTLVKGSYVTADSVALSDLARGDIVIVRHNDEKWVMRVAGLPADRIALVNGVVVLDGERVKQQPVGDWTITDSAQGRSAKMLSERFPGERRSHRILDDGMTPGDNFAEIVLGPDEYFLLGDNRDHAADSRFDDAEFFFGLGVVKGNDIVRRLDPPES
jgi:signal peptidase I